MIDMIIFFFLFWIYFFFWETNLLEVEFIHVPDLLFYWAVFFFL